MRWILGVDVRPSSDGALRFAHWLQSHTEGAHEIIPVHVLEESYLNLMLRYRDLDEIMQRASDNVRASLATAGFPPSIQPTVMPGSAAEKVLSQMAHDHDADGLLVGRQAPSGTHPWVRLGRVARRLLRQVPRTLVVTPPDLSGAPGGGPILVATDLGPDSVSAVRLGQELAQQLGRPLLLSHVVPMAGDFGAHYIPADTLERFRLEQTNLGKRELAAWLRDQGLQDAQHMLLQGSIIDNLVELCRREQVPFMVCGCRRLSLMERMAQASIATELSSASQCPVVVVPPTAA